MRFFRPVRRRSAAGSESEFTKSERNWSGFWQRIQNLPIFDFLLAQFQRKEYDNAELNKFQGCFQDDGKLKAEETLENPLNGCRRCKAKAESLRQKDRASMGGWFLPVFLRRSCFVSSSVFIW